MAIVFLLLHLDALHISSAARVKLQTLWTERRANGEWGSAPLCDYVSNIPVVMMLRKLSGRMPLVVPIRTSIVRQLGYIGHSVGWSPQMGIGRNTIDIQRFQPQSSSDNRLPCEGHSIHVGAMGCELLLLCVAAL